MDEEQKAKHVHGVFQNISSKYDKMNSIISFNRHRAWRKDVLKYMDVKEGSKALDLCTGTGDWALAMAPKMGAKGKIIGLDFSKNMLEVAKEKKLTNNLDNISFVHGDAMNLPYADHTFDYVTIGFGLRNVPNYEQVLQEMYRVTKPGGIAVCLETSQPTMFGFKQLFNFYFRFIMPLFGKIFAKSYKEYAWLHDSTQNFPDKKTLKNMFLQVGFSEVLVKSYSGGVAAMHLARK